MSEDHEFSRTEMLIGTEALNKLHKASVAVFGIGGVGSFAAEALARSGIGHLTLVDHDIVGITNLNRQLVALHSTIGKKKIEVMKERILDINPKCVVKTLDLFYSEKNADELDLSGFSYIVDAIDTVTSKLLLIVNAKKAKVPIISCMGAGNKLDPIGFEIADIYNTSVCPLAKVMRKELRNRGIRSLKVVYSKEEAVKPKYEASGASLKPQSDSCSNAKSEDKSCCDLTCEVSPDRTKQTGKRHIPGSISFVPSSAGLVLASEVIKDLIL